MTKKLLALITALFAAVTLNAAVGVTADAKYLTNYIDKGTLVFENVLIAGAELEASGFVLGVTTFNTLQDKTTVTTVGKTTVSSTAAAGLFKRIDTNIGYKFTSPLADLTFGGTYHTFSKTAQSNGYASSVEPFAKLSGGVKNTKFTWDVLARADLKNHTNNLQANVRLPFGFNSLKLVPALGYGFNDPTAATIAAFKDSKQYVIAGLGVATYIKGATVSADVYQRRDSLFTAGNTINGVSGGLSVKF
jgi:hypothetical protein